MRLLHPLLSLSLVAGALTLAGCEQPQTPTRVGADGTVLVEIAAGLRCHQGQCLLFDPVLDEARIMPFDFVALPPGVRVGGVMTEAEFRDTYERARRAPLGGPEED